MTSTADRIAALNRILDLPDPTSDIYITMRNLLIDPSDDDNPFHIDSTLFATIRDHLLAIDEHAALPHDESSTHARSLLLLDFSLCPVHRIDYAICFDDEDPDCAQIRAYFPSHDT